MVLAPLNLLAAGLRRDLIQQTAVPVLVLRVAEGLASWLLFNEVFLVHTPYAWVVHAAFLVYFGSNLVSSLSYHTGRVSTRVVCLDLFGNLMPLTVAIWASGGIASPMVLIFLLKIAGYALIFGPECGVLSIMVGAASLLAVFAGNGLGWWAVVPITVLSPELQRLVNDLVRGLVLIIGCAGAVHFLRQASVKDAQVRHEVARTREAAERERAAAGVTGALLAVSEAVSRPVRLDEMLAKVVEVVPRVLPVDYCSIFLWRDDRGIYVGAAATGLEVKIARQFREMRLPPEQAPDFEWVRRLGHCAMVSPSNWQPLGIPMVPTALIAPLVSGEHFFGVMQLARRRGGPSFSGGDMKLADGIGGQIAVALERIRLEEESRRLVRAVESAGEAVLIADAHRRIRFVNSAFLQTFGYTREDLIGRDTDTLTDRLSPESLRELDRNITAQGWMGEAIARRRDGSEFPIMLDASLIRDERDRIVGAVAILKDISEEKLLQEQLRRADRLAASGEMAAGIAHEVNNALVGILAQAELAHSETGVGELRAALTRVEGQGRRIASIVQALLGFARPQAPRSQAVDLCALVPETVTLLDHDLRSHGIEVVLDCPSHLPPVQVDAKQIEQVLVNLFTNAIQAMASGGGTLSIRGLVENDRVRVDISDTGRGIAAEHLARIFEPFFTTKQEGSGLGLSVSYGIVRAHGGELTAHSRPGQGSTFRIVLPTAPRATIDGLRTALVVDDDEQVAEALVSMLEQEGLTTERVATGGEALALLGEANFDVVLLDVRLPDISGTEVFSRLQSMRPALAERVVFVTGGLWRSESALRAQLPERPTLRKPCTGVQLREVLHTLSVHQAA